MNTRRQFLVGCSALVAAASLTPESLLAASLQAKAVPLAEIPFDDFYAQLGSWFKVFPKDQPAMALKLVEAKLTPSTHPLAHQAEDAHNEKFSLLFSGAGELPQDTHAFEHGNIGGFSMFIVPVKIEGATYYQAIFNRTAAVMNQPRISHV